ncbi:hypothetical protein IFM47457_10714 [Aspergillus lentulus]|nr:hypothetical protein IFM47457_10714 [Aspergillus lentulus]
MKLAINRQNLEEAQWGRYRGVSFYRPQLPRGAHRDVIPCTTRGDTGPYISGDREVRNDVSGA